jgi:cobalamin transport system ATP-binding protein
VLLQAVDLSFGYARPRRRRASADTDARHPRDRAEDSSGLVVDRLSFSIERGALVGVLGPNGSGKTTLLRLLAGTLAPAAGRVLLDGQDIARMPRGALARRFAVVPQETQLAFDYSALEIALMGRYPHLGPFELEGPDDLTSAMTALETTGTRHLADRLFRTLSGGEKQRVIIASALAQLDDSLSSRDPSILFLDEPTASLDLRYQIEMVDLLRRLHDRQDVSIVLTTHDVHFARLVCSDLILLRAGRILARGAPAETLTTDRIVELYDVARSAIVGMAP